MTQTSTVYSGRTTNWPVVVISALLAAALVVFGKPWRGPWPGEMIPILVVVAIEALVLLTSTSQRVTTGPNGVLVRCGPFGRPRFAYPRERIARVEVIRFSIWTTWNWGISWRPSTGWVLVLRSGPALRLTLADGRQAVIGVSDPAAAVAALEA